MPNSHIAIIPQCTLPNRYKSIVHFMITMHKHHETPPIEQLTYFIWFLHVVKPPHAEPFACWSHEILRIFLKVVVDLVDLRKRTPFTQWNPTSRIPIVSKGNRFDLLALWKRPHTKPSEDVDPCLRFPPWVFKILNLVDFPKFNTHTQTHTRGCFVSAQTLYPHSCPT